MCGSCNRPVDNIGDVDHRYCDLRDRKYEMLQVSMTAESVSTLNRAHGTSAPPKPNDYGRGTRAKIMECRIQCRIIKKGPRYK